MTPNNQYVQAGTVAYQQQAQPAVHIAHMPGYQGQGSVYQSRNGSGEVGHRGGIERSSGSQHPYRNLFFVCVEVLRPSQPNVAMSSAVSLPNHTFTGLA